MSQTNEERMLEMEDTINTTIKSTIEEVDSMLGNLSRQLSENTNTWEIFQKKRYELVTGSYPTEKQLETFRSIREEVGTEFRLWEKMEYLLSLRETLQKSKALTIKDDAARKSTIGNATRLAGRLGVQELVTETLKDTDPKEVENKIMDELSTANWGEIVTIMPNTESRGAL